MHRPLRAAGLGLLLGLTGSAIAHAEEASTEEKEATRAEEPRFELGALAGVHLFADDLELGVPDDENVPELSSAPLVGARVSYAVVPRWLALEAETVFVSSRATTSGDRDSFALVIGWRAHALLHIGRFGKVRPFVLAGGGALSILDSGDEVAADTDLVGHFGAGVKIDITPRVLIRLDARYLPVPNTEDYGVSHDFEFHGGVSFLFGAKEAAEVVVIEKTPVDSDGDGIFDDDDRCIREAEDKDGFEDADGCPDLDNDADGVADATDKCPLEKENRNGVDDEDGCPDTDEDKDGIFGSLDKCPTEPEDKDGFEDDNGCPDLDNDADGVPDAKDKCPTEAETWNGYQDDDGCKDQLPDKVKKFTGVIEGITFKKDSAEIQKRSFALLDRAYTVMNEFPDVKMEISGHTSDEGEHDYNVDLSKRRAESVKNYLVGKGVAAERIQTIGYGPDKPMADNKTKKGKALNRRIEFKVVIEGGAP
jgi:outer membrane protein OmpA-like peptidoglycan-associated protein